MAFQDFDLISQRRQQERRQKIRRQITAAVVASVVLLLIVGSVIGAMIVKGGVNSSDATTSTKEKSNSKPHHAASAESTKASSSTADSKASSSSFDSDSSSPKSSSATHSAAVKAPDVDIVEAAAEEVCAAVDYKKTCEGSITKQIGNTKVAPEPRDIIKASIDAALAEIVNVSKQIGSFEFDTPFKKAALNDCLILLNDAKEELNSSVSSIKGKDLEVETPELKNWLSAVLSYQQTCVDGFPDGREKDKMEKLLNTSKELGSNALAIVSQLSSIFKASDGSKSQRRLLAEEDYDDGHVPNWFDEESRRILKADAAKFTPNVTVAKDGSENFTTINAALQAMPEKCEGRFVIYIKEGIYEENVIISKKLQNLTMFGDGSQKSIVTGSKNYVDGVPTYQTATFAVAGDGFLAQSLGFRNTAGPEKHQAVALRVQSDRSAFVNCRMEGYQDTLYVQTHRQFYRACYITGTVDFIFGDAAAIFQNCMIYVRKPMENQKNVVTAQGRIDKRETTGIVLQNCKILADDQLEFVKDKFKSYLGRPWKEYSKTIVMESQIGDVIAPEGWLEWEGDFALKTLYYGEYNNKGKGSSTSERVKWVGHKIMNKDEAMNYTVGPFLQGETWLKVAKVPVRFGMFT